MKKLSRKFWLWCGVSVVALVGLIVSLIKGWNIGATLFAVALLIAAIFAVKEYNNGGLQSDLQIESAQMSGDSMIITGVAFAENQGDAGSVSVPGNVVSWSDSRIVFVPETVPADVYIINGDGEKSNTVGVK